MDQNVVEPSATEAVNTTEPALNLAPSVLSELRKARAKIGTNAAPIDMVIPGYDGKLIARFRWVPVGDLTVTSESLKKIKDERQQLVAACADALVALNDEIFVKLDDTLESLQHNGEAVTFSNGEGLAVALGVPAPRSARECVQAVFGNDYALTSMGQKLMEWLEDTSKEVDGAYLGE